MTREALSSSAQAVRAAVDGRRPARSVLRLLGLHRRRVLVALLFFAVKDTPLWLLPVITAQVIDIVVDQRPPIELALWGGIAVVALLQNYPGHVLYTRFFMGVVRRTGADLRNALAARLQELSIGFHTRANSAVVQTKVVRDVENIEVMLQQTAHPLLSATMVLLGAVTMTAIAVPQFLPVYALAIPLAVALRALLHRRSLTRNEAFRREVEHFSARVGEMAALMPITRAHGLEHTARQRVADGAEGVRTAGFALDLLNGRFASLSWVSLQLLGVGCLILAAWFSLTGFLPISAGEVVLLSSYFALLTTSATGLLMLLPIVARGTESVRSIAEVLQDPDLERNEGKTAVGEVRGRIELQGVTFAYGDGASGAGAARAEHPEAAPAAAPPPEPAPTAAAQPEPAPAARPALDGIDLAIEPGETIAFVGSSGSGKSTMLNLVLGFVRPTRGRVLLDGVDMETLDLRSVRRRVSVVPQESVLFEGTIRENIAYGLGEVEDARLEQALRDANALEIVTALPEGWHTVVGERGARLSGGQRQRLSIARALVRDPSILLLDEATSALDSGSEAVIAQALDRLMQGRTTLVVAHRLSTIRSADRIVVLERGRIVEVGPHDELLARGGRYAQLHGVQAG